jgi:hypothetical protein
MSTNPNGSIINLEALQRQASSAIEAAEEAAKEVAVRHKTQLSAEAGKVGSDLGAFAQKIKDAAGLSTAAAGLPPASGGMKRTSKKRVNKKHINKKRTSKKRINKKRTSKKRVNKKRTSKKSKKHVRFSFRNKSLKRA